jgi:hypothetical protein
MIHTIDKIIDVIKEVDKDCHTIQTMRQQQLFRKNNINFRAKAIAIAESQR